LELKRLPGGAEIRYAPIYKKGFWIFKKYLVPKDFKSFPLKIEGLHLEGTYAIFAEDPSTLREVRVREREDGLELKLLRGIPAPDVLEHIIKPKIRMEILSDWNYVRAVFLDRELYGGFLHLLSLNRYACRRGKDRWRELVDSEAVLGNCRGGEFAPVAERSGEGFTVLRGHLSSVLKALGVPFEAFEEWYDEEVRGLGGAELPKGLREYQKEAVSSALRHLAFQGAVTIQAPTGSGKTEMALAIAEVLRDKLGRRALYLSLSRSLVAQTVRRARAFGLEARHLRGGPRRRARGRDGPEPVEDAEGRASGLAGGAQRGQGAGDSGRGPPHPSYDGALNSEQAGQDAEAGALRHPLEGGRPGGLLLRLRGEAGGQG